MSATSVLRRSFRRLFGRYLLVTNTVSCGALLGLGDITVQLLIPGGKHTEGDERPNPGKDPSSTLSRIDWRRTARMTAVGAMLGPFNHGWYKVLDHYFPAATMSVIPRMILLDQLVASPIGYYIFFTSGGLMEGKHITQTWRELRDKFWTVYKVDWSFWPAAQCVNFYFVAPKFRVLYVSGASFIWSIFLSYAKHNDVSNIASKLKSSPQS